jgi:hypothetical protein
VALDFRMELKLLGKILMKKTIENKKKQKKTIGTVLIDNHLKKTIGTVLIDNHLELL